MHIYVYLDGFKDLERWERLSLEKVSWFSASTPYPRKPLISLEYKMHEPSKAWKHYQINK